MAAVRLRAFHAGTNARIAIRNAYTPNARDLMGRGHLLAYSSGWPSRLATRRPTQHEYDDGKRFLAIMKQAVSRAHLA
jgi:hypothetical protein